LALKSLGTIQARRRKRRRILTRIESGQSKRKSRKDSMRKLKLEQSRRLLKRVLRRTPAKATSSLRV
jgi:hypothetical protein